MNNSHVVKDGVSLVVLCSGKQRFIQNSGAEAFLRSRSLGVGSGVGAAKRS